MSKGTVITLMGAFITVVSTFFSWYSFDFLGTSVTVKPWKDNIGMGNTLLVLAVLAAVFCIMAGKTGKKRLNKATLIIGVLILLVAFANYPDDSLVEGINTQMGYWLTWVGGAMTVGGTVIQMKSHS